MWDLEEFVMWGLGAILGAICIIVIGAIIFLGVDSIGIEDSSASAVVLDKSYVPETTVTSFLTVGNIQVPQVQTYPESWSAAVRTQGGKVISCVISQAQYSVLGKGSAVEVGVGSGRMSGSPYCTRLATQ